MAVIHDQISRRVELRNPPQRIVSLVPSQTEMLVDLGLENKIMGVTKFCVHPKNMRKNATIIGGTKNLHINKIEDLKPDLIIANKEENNREDIEKLEKKFQIYVSNIENFNDVKAFINDIGALTANGDLAKNLIHNLDKTLNEIAAITHSLKPINALYFIWKNPYMVAGSDTFISKMLALAKVNNAISQLGKEGLRYPEIELTKIHKLQPDVLLLSSEPYPFKQKHADEMTAVTSIRSMPVDGELFSWYGTRILHTMKQFKECVYQIHRSKL